MKKISKQLRVQLDDFKETSEDASRGKSRADQLTTELAAAIADLKDQLEEEEERNKEFIKF